MIGRDAQQRALDGALSQAAAGRAATIVVEGAPGIGKTSLLDFAATRRPAGSLILRASGHRAEAELPYAGLHQLISPVVGWLDDLPPPQAAALARALALETGAPGDRLAIASALLGLITQAAAQRVVVVIVDDFGCLDPSTKQALVFVARRVDADAVAILLGARTGTAPELDGLGAHLRVGALSEPEARELLRLHFPDLGAAVSARIVQQAAGIPLALLQIPAELDAEQRAGRAALPMTLPVGAFIESLYASRLDALADRGRLALLVASFEDLDATTFTRAMADCELGPDDLEASERMGLVRVEEGRCVFTHPTVRVAIQDVATSGELARAHEALARCFIDDPGRYALHIQGRGVDDDAEVAEALVAAARQAAQRSGLTEASAFWEAAARRTPAGPARRALLSRAVCGFVRAGAGPRALSGLAELVDEAGDDAERCHWQALAVVTSLWTEGALPEGAEALASMAVELTGRQADADAEAGAELFMALAMSWHIWGDYRAAKKLAGQVRALRPRSTLSIGQLLMCDILDVMSGEPGAGTVLRSGWAEELSDDALGDPSIPGVFAAMTLLWLDEVDACERVARRYRSLFAIDGNVAAARLSSRSLMARVWERRGDWDRAALEYASAQMAAIDSDFTAPYPSVTLRFAGLRAMQGRAEECLDLIARALATARQPSPSIDHLAACARGMLHLACGRYREAAEVLGGAAASERDHGTMVVGYSSRFVDQFEALWHLGRTDEMVAELSAFEAAAERSGYLTAHASVSRCRALLAPVDGFDEDFDRAVAGFEQATQAFEVARTYLLWGLRLRRGRRKRDARLQLLEAYRRFESLGAGTWLDLCRSELAACGERRIADLDVAGPLATLTPREFEIAQVAVTGASNAAVAERLFISQRTVEYHLSNVYRKVEVANRQGLSALFPPQP